MNRRQPMMVDPAWVGGIAGMLGALLVASLSLGQVPLPDVGGVVSDASQTATQAAQDATSTATETASQATQTATETASDATKSATDTAQDATKSATDTARDTTKSATDTARDAAKSGSKTARDAAKSGSRTARDATKSATDTARDATKSGTNTARDATRSATDTAGDVTKSGADTARDATRSATGTARDATRSATDTARDAARDATDTARDTARSATETARDATRSAADAARDATDTVQDATRDATEATRDAASNATDATRTTQQSVRETARDAASDVNRNVRETVDDVRSTTRNAAESAIDSTQRSIRSDTSVRSSNSFGTSNVRGADLGVWFDRSIRDGLVIADVAADAALAQVGFVEGDRIVSVNGRTISSEQDFMRIITAENVRQPVDVVVMRDGQQETLVIDPVVIRERYATVRTDPLERFGIILDDRITDRLVVWRVTPRSPAFYAGIRPGDEITMFAGQRIADPTKFIQIVERTDPGVVEVQVNRSGRMRQFEVDYPQYQVSEQRTTYRQDLDAATGSSNVRGQVNTDIDANINPSGANIRGQTDAAADVDAQLPAAPSSGDVQYNQPSNRPSYRGSGSGGYQRRGFFRRR